MIITYILPYTPAMSFDLYAKYGNNRTLSLVSPKRPYYQWRLRVPSGHLVRLVVLTLHAGATPGSCAAHKLSAYDFLLPLQNKIIARWVGGLRGGGGLLMGGWGSSGWGNGGCSQGSTGFSGEDLLVAQLRTEAPHTGE